MAKLHAEMKKLYTTLNKQNKTKLNETKQNQTERETKQEIPPVFHATQNFSIPSEFVDLSEKKFFSHKIFKEILK